MSRVKRGSFVHVEFASEDPGRTRRFLEQVFGWEFQTTPEPNYLAYATPSGPGGAVTKLSGERPPGILNYVLSDDIEGDLRRIEGAGGKVRLGKTEIPYIGWWALFEEPMGGVLALFQTLSSDRGPVARFR
jgi:uncharacterized protein